ncbi:alpha/beta hydrolase [Metabacillus sp. RGM 3146]|uniref:alpha/beta hydrolase n=1 Tax=Metabacillus sp. RGM 3146 TaxID=3401092 RepID=UPI003B9D8645
MNRDRKVAVYLPPNYKTSHESYPVLYMHDGQNVFKGEDARYGTSWGVPDFLDQSDINLIVVGIDCNHHRFERFNEYGPWVNRTISKQVIDIDEPLGGEGPAYIDYLVHELKPFIDEKYRTITNETSMMGSSMGGLISTYAACKYPNIFKRAAPVSSAYWFNQKEIEELVKLSDLSVIEKFNLDIGTKEVSSKIDAKQ